MKVTLSVLSFLIYLVSFSSAAFIQPSQPKDGLKHISHDGMKQVFDFFAGLLDKSDFSLPDTIMTSYRDVSKRLAKKLEEPNKFETIQKIVKNTIAPIFGPEATEIIQSAIEEAPRFMKSLGVPESFFQSSTTLTEIIHQTIGAIKNKLTLLKDGEGFGEINIDGILEKILPLLGKGSEILDLGSNFGSQYLNEIMDYVKDYGFTLEKSDGSSLGKNFASEREIPFASFIQQLPEIFKDPSELKDLVASFTEILSQIN